MPEQINSQKLKVCFKCDFMLSTDMIFEKQYGLTHKKKKNVYIVDD